MSVDENIDCAGISLQQIQHLALAAGGLEQISRNDRSRVISFRHLGTNTRINVYYSTGTVGTAMNHHTKGTTQLFRKNVDHVELYRILLNPRVHTGKGYYTREQWRAIEERERAGMYYQKCPEMDWY